MPDGSQQVRLLLVDDVVDVATMYEMQLAAQGLQGRELGAHDYLIKAHTPPAALAEATREWVS